MVTGGMPAAGGHGDNGVIWAGGTGPGKFTCAGNQVPSNRPVWLAIIILTAVLAAAGSGFLLYLAKATPAGALIGSGTAFAATMTLGMAASRFLSD